MKLKLGGYVLDAHSVGGVETCFQVPAFGLCLDIGRCPPGAEGLGTLLLTHGHIDHAAGLPYYASLRGMLGMRPPQIYCPRTALEPLSDVLEAWSRLQSDSERCTLEGVAPGDEVQISNGFARAFRSPHRMECVGYTLFRRVRKLRPELIGESTEAIAERARRGEVVSTEVSKPEICFPGDTRAEVIESEPTVTTAKVLLLECTFLGDRVSAAKARQSGHIHLDEIAERADLFKNEAILLTHFSRRYAEAEIRSEVERKFPQSLRDRVHLLIHGP